MFYLYEIGEIILILPIALSFELIEALEAGGGGGIMFYL